MSETLGAWCMVAANDTVLAASPGWLRLYAPPGSPALIGANHVDFYLLREYPDYYAQYLAAKAGKAGMWAGKVRTVGCPSGFAAVWHIYPCQGGVLLTNEDFELILEAVRTATFHAPDTRTIFSELWPELGQRATDADG